MHRCRGPLVVRREAAGWATFWIVTGPLAARGRPLRRGFRRYRCVSLPSVPQAFAMSRLSPARDREELS
jgi:hypothetical protein